MDLAHLSTFCSVVEAGSISKAAKELFVTQPAISLKIQELEEHYQVQLLDRTNKGISPTEAGLFVYGEAQKVMALIASIEREIELSRNPIEDLSIGASSTIGDSILPCTLLIYRGRNPGYNLTVDIGNTTQVVEKLVSRRVEIALVEGPINHSWRDILVREDISVKKVAQTRLILVAGSNGQYRETTSMSLEELFEAPLIMREGGSGIRTTFEQVIATNGLSTQDFNIIYEMSSSSSIISAVASDMGLALLPVMALRKELRHKILKNIGLTNIKFKHDFNLLYRNDSKKLSHKAFIDLVCSKERGFC
jgi:LysR family transcriptional regulator, transcriptional activator of the cysJI operon